MFFFKNLEFLLNGRNKVINAFQSNIFLMGILGDNGREKTTLSKISKRKTTHRKIILTRKQMFQRLLIALAQVKAGNTSENLLNEICHHVLLKMYIIISKIQYRYTKMDTIYSWIQKIVEYMIHID